MKKIFSLLLFFVLTFYYSVNAQENVVFDFENLNLPDTGFWNGADNSGFYGNDILSFENYCNTQYNYWSGFSYSNWTDTYNQSLDNQWSTYVGQAYSGNVFGLAYVPIDCNNNYQNIPINLSFINPVEIKNIKLSNSTYTALTILNGDAICSAFSEGDYFFVKITSYYLGLETGADTLYLADYRNGQNIIINTWTEVDLTNLGTVDSLHFNLFSSDTGIYGMNTPAYFCLDDVEYISNTIISEKNENLIQIYPNPASDFITISDKFDFLSIYDMSGKIIMVTTDNIIDVRDFQNGIYIVKIETENQINTTKFIKI